MKTALDVFQNINPVMVLLYGRKPSFFRAASITLVVVTAYGAIAWVGDALFLRHLTDPSATHPYFGLLEDYTHHLLVMSVLFVLFGCKQLQLFLAEIPFSGETDETKSGVYIGKKFVRRLLFFWLALCLVLYVYAQLWTPWLSSDRFIVTWATAPDKNFFGWFAAFFGSFFSFVVVLSLATWLITSCVFVVMPKIAEAIRENLIVLKPLHPDKMGGQGYLVKTASALALTYMSALVYVIAFAYAFGTSLEYYIGLTAYIILAPFVAARPFLNIHSALDGAKRAKIEEFADLHAVTLIAKTGSQRSGVTTDLSLAEIDSLYQRYVSINTWPVSLRTILAIIAPVAVPIMINIARQMVENKSGGLLGDMVRLFG